MESDGFGIFLAVVMGLIFVLGYIFRECLCPTEEGDGGGGKGPEPGPVVPDPEPGGQPLPYDDLPEHDDAWERALARLIREDAARRGIKVEVWLLK